MIKALIADDDTLVAGSIKDRCEALGWQTMVSSTSAGLVGNIKKYVPDVIFLDILLPGKTGLEIIDDLKREMPEYLKKTVIITSMDNPSYMADAVEKGVLHYATKNTEDPSHIMEIAKKIVGKKHE